MLSDTHVSEDDFNVINENLHSGHRTTRGRLLPYCVFTDPPLACVGIDEAQARKINIAYCVASLPTDAVWRPWTLSEKHGFIKTIGDTYSDRILGFTAFGPEAGELMGTVQSAKPVGHPYTLLRDAILAHPTMTEGRKALFAGVPERAGHRVGKP
jgi:pyruvate/2-oxoglutarate dehydrogenase complex dihydrolipoamide dehydrogenase (E3) component